MSSDGGGNGGNDGGGYPEGVDADDVPEGAPTSINWGHEGSPGSEEAGAGGDIEENAYPADKWSEEDYQGMRTDYWTGVRDDLGYYPMSFYTDRENLQDLGKGLLSLATPMGFKAVSALFSAVKGGKGLAPDENQSPAPDDPYDEGGPGWMRWTEPRRTNVRAIAPKTEKKEKKAAISAASTTSDQPTRTATGRPSAGIMANIRTTPYGLLGDAPVTRKTLMGR